MKSKEFLNSLADFADELRKNIEANCAGWDDDPKAIEARVNAVNDPVTGFEYFVMNYFPHYLRHAEQSQLHKYLFSRLPDVLSNPKSQLDALAAPRGEAKSTIVTRLFSLYCVLTARKRYIVIISDTIDQAAEFIEAIKIELEVNPRIKIDFPNIFGAGSKWQVNKAVTRNNIKLQGAGARKKLRGFVHGAYRPDLVIIDDLENDENVQTPDQRNKLHKWLKRAVLKLGAAGEKFDCFYIGTILHYDSVLNRCVNNNGWNARIFQAIIRYPDNMAIWDTWEAIYKSDESDDNAIAYAYYQQNQAEMDKGAIVSWSARPIYELMVIRARDGHADFDSEYQNDPAAGEDATFHEGIHYWHTLPHNLLVFGALDPSLGKFGSSRDPSAIVIGGYDQQTGKLYIIEAQIKKRLPDRIIEDVIAMQQKYQCLAWAVESVQFQEFLRTELVKRSAKRGVPVPAKAVHPKHDKILRIEALQPHMANELILLHHDQKTLIDQFKHFPKASHDDGPDAVEMCWKLAEGFVQPSQQTQALHVPEPSIYM